MQLWCHLVFVSLKQMFRVRTNEKRICAAEMAVRYAALAEKYMCIIVIR